MTPVVAQTHYHPLLIKPDPTGASGAILDVKDEISADDYLRYRTAYWTIYDKLTLNMFVFVRQSGVELMTLWEQANAALTNGQVSSVDPSGIVRWTTKLRLAVLSFCSTLVYHQDQNYILVKKKFGDGSPEHIAMQKIFNGLYDECFGYRYLYKLRNTMVHYTMDAVSVKTVSTLHQGSKVALFDMILDRSALLDAKKFLNATNKAELKGLPGSPSVFQMVVEAMSHIGDVNEDLTSIMTPDIEELCKTVIEFNSLFEGESGVRALQVIEGELVVGGQLQDLNYSAMAGQVFDYAHERVGAV